MQARVEMAKLVPELLVSDFARAHAFYTGVLGFCVLYDRPDEAFAYLDRNGAHLMIEERDAGGERDWVAAALCRPYGRGMNLQIEVEEVGALAQRCMDAGAEIFWPLEERWYRRLDHEVGVRQFIVKDPDGYLLRLSEVIGTRPAAGKEEA